MKSVSLAVASLLFAAVSSASVVQPLGTGSQLLIPAAGSTAGANGTFFRSDIAIINLRDTTQSVRLEWLPQVGGTSVVRFIDIPSLNGIRSADFVKDVLGQSGLGSILVTGVNVAQPDPSARLFVSSRIWTPQPGSNGGTTSQSLPAIPIASINTPAAVFFGFSGQDNPANYRVNVGIVNLDSANTQTFTVAVPSAIGVPGVQVVTLPPFTMTQVTLGSGFPGSSQIQVRNDTTGSRSNFWTAYVSTVDNVTGDAFSELPITVTLTAP